MQAQVLIGGREILLDLSQPVDLSVELDFAGPQPRHFGAPRAHAEPFAVEGFRGSVAQGGSCNCEVLTLIPHCHGTHTECVGHLTRERLHAWRVVPSAPTPAVLLSVSPEPASHESTDPPPQASDRLITGRAIEHAWPSSLPFTPQAVVIRTLPNTPDKRSRDYTGTIPPYLSQEAAAQLVSRGVLHLVVDVPSIDREHDAGRLTAHRVFFGLPPGAAHLAAAARAAATVTELAFIPDELPDGAYLLQLQVPAMSGDAVPSRPLLYALGVRRS